MWRIQWRDMILFIASRNAAIISSHLQKLKLQKLRTCQSWGWTFFIFMIRRGPRIQVFCVYTRRIFFRNLIESNRIQIVFAIFRLISNQMDIRLVPNQSENGKYNLIPIWFNKISKRFLCVWAVMMNMVQRKIYSTLMLT